MKAEIAEKCLQIEQLFQKSPESLKFLQKLEEGDELEQKLDNAFRNGHFRQSSTEIKKSKAKHSE